MVLTCLNNSPNFLHVLSEIFFSEDCLAIQSIMTLHTFHFSRLSYPYRLNKASILFTIGIIFSSSLLNSTLYLGYALFTASM